MQITEQERYIASLDRAQSGIDLSFLRGRCVLVAGAAGMLGSCVVDLLRRYGQCRVIAMGRNAAAMEARFGPADDTYSFYWQDVSAPVAGFCEDVDYIIHAASNADPVRMAEDPVGTLMANVLGTRNLLDYGLTHKMKRFLFVSSGEVYGQPNAALDDFTEDYCGPLDLSRPRSSYPEGKRAAEVLCQSCISQFGADGVVVRPCHLYGPTMTRRDSRAVSEFLWNAVDGQDIVMKSEGLMERSHCYVVDAAQALLAVLGKGECGGAYNIADRRSQMRICDFANRAAQAGGCRVVYRTPERLEQSGYSKVSRAVLDASRLEALGWRPQTEDGIQETVAILRESRQDRIHAERREKEWRSSM